MFHEVWELERLQTAKNNLQSQSRALAMVPFDKPHTIFFFFTYNFSHT